MRKKAVLVFLFSAGLASVLVAGEGVVALSTGAVTCDNASGDRYVDCTNGTVTDTDSGLIWLQDANCFGLLTWTDATLTVAGLSHGQCGLTDGSSPGEWRLPSITEWADAVAAAVAMSCPTPTLTNDVGTSCFNAGGGSSFLNVVGGAPVYWSATVPSVAPANVLTVNLAGGSTSTQVSKLGFSYIWPVRLSQ
jgi:hypothetical protein